MNMNKVYEEVKAFNTIAGNLGVVDGKSIDAQLGFCFEELTETIDEYEKDIFTGKLSDATAKEAADLVVVVFGLLQKMQAAGYDMQRAMDIVNDNNLSKFPEAGTMEHMPSTYSEKGWDVKLNTNYMRWIIKDQNGKVMKPLGYVKADVTGVSPETTPKEFFKGVE